MVTTLFYNIHGDCVQKNRKNILIWLSGRRRIVDLVGAIRPDLDGRAAVVRLDYAVFGLNS